ncbi:MAG: AtpZ/AtpI family protein [Rickettsiales endosymbiont of Dermacentor nuttalli]
MLDEQRSSFKELSDKISKIRTLQEEKKSGAQNKSSETKVFNICIEFVVVIVVGSFLGYSLDQYLNTTPILLIIGVLLGAVAGMVNITKLAKNLEDKE